MRRKRGPERSSPSKPHEPAIGPRAKLLQAALRMVTEEGIEAISMREVARRAGVSSGAPFRHFPDRNALLAAIADEGYRLIDAHKAQLMLELEGDVVGQLKAVGVASSIFAASHPAHYRVMKLPGLQTAYPPLQSWVDARRENVKAIIMAGQKSGLIRDWDPEALVLLCLSVVDGLAQQFLDNSSPSQTLADVKRIAEEVLLVCGLGLGSDAARKLYEVQQRRRRPKRRVRLASNTRRRTP